MRQHSLTTDSIGVATDLRDEKLQWSWQRGLRDHEGRSRW